MERLLTYLQDFASIGDIIGAFGGYISLYAIYVLCAIGCPKR